MEETERLRSGCWVRVRPTSNIRSALTGDYLALLSSEPSVDPGYLLFTCWPDEKGAICIGWEKGRDLISIAEPLPHVETLIAIGYFEPHLQRIADNNIPF